MRGSTRRAFLATAGASVVRAQLRKPNVLLFLTDQESALLPGPCSLPGRERLWKAGAVEFTHAFCNTPQCSPARSSLLTGLEPHHTGVLTNVDGGSLGKALSPSVPNLGSVLAAEGYQTAYFGKWHLGGRKGELTPYGFQSQFEGTDEAVSAEAAGWIRGRRGPWLAVVSVLNPHDIYRIPRELKNVAIRAGVRPPATGLANLRGKPAEQRWFADADQGR